MILFPLITITDSTPFILHVNTEKWSVRHTLTHLTAWADDAGDNIYVGNKPEGAISILSVSALINTNIARWYLPQKPVSNSPTPPGFAGIMPGYVWSKVDDATDDGNYVVANHGWHLEMRNNFGATYDGSTLEPTVFTPPDVTSLNGLPILPGGERQWTTSSDARFLSKPIKFVVATGETAYLRLAYEVA